MSQISLIQATPPSFNPGMLFSEVIAKLLVEKFSLQDKTTFYRFLPALDRLAHLPPNSRYDTLRRMDTGAKFEHLKKIEQIRAA